MGAPKGGNSGRRNLEPYKNKPGERRGGRKTGTPNKLTAERMEEEIRRIALMDPLALFERVHGRRRQFTLREITSMAPEIRACIASVKVKTENLTTGDQKQDTTVEIRLWNKINALELCAKHFGWIEERVDHSGEIQMRWLLPGEK